MGDYYLLNEYVKMDEQERKQADIKNWATLSRSILNGVVGDYLAKESNPLAIDMAYYHQGHALVLNESLAQQMHNQPEKPLSNKIIVLVHGLTNLETIWDFKAEASPNEALKEASNKDNYGLRVQEDYGYTPFYLRYNTGLPIKENGQKLNALLCQLKDVYPIEIDEIVLMGFSMGGLLARSAQQIAQDTQAEWIKKLSNCYYIGTPHEGSPLEKFGHLTSSIVRLIPREYVSHWADWIDVRSQGIQDLKDGLLNLKNADSKQTADLGDPYEQSVRCGSFYVGAQHHFISGALSENKDSLVNKFFGDSLVRQTSSNPISAPEDCKSAHFDGIPHFPLAHSKKVYQQIKQWFGEHNRNVELHYAEGADIADEQATKEQALSSQGISHLQGLSNQEIISGTIDLLVTAYDHTVEAVEKVHHSIADEPLNILKKIPVVGDVTSPVSVAHKEILDTIYFSLKEGGKLAHKGAKLINLKRKKT
ncbi:MAG: pimeloyl-ACP methyl ester carboxylesterase [Pseudohongiellaceae bacterium]